MAVTTATELRNEAREALQKAMAARDEAAEGWKEKFDGYFAEYEEKRKAADAAKADEDKIADAMKGLEGIERDDVPVRSPGDAAIKTESADTAKAGVKLADGRVAQYANDKTEGWIKGYPASVQHPDIIKRLTPEMEAAADEERQAFSRYIRHGMKALGDTDRKALGRLRDPEKFKDLQEGTDSEGGFLVPTDQRTDVILARGVLNGVTRPISTNFTTSRDGGTFPASTDDVDFAIVAEEATFGEDDPTFSQVSFTIRKPGRMAQVSAELLEDSAVNIPALLNLLFGNGIGRYEDQQSIEGDGTTEPLGLRTTGAAQGNVGDITDLLTIAAPTALEIINAFYELPAQWRGGATWHTTSSFLARIVGIGPAAAGIHFIETLGNEPTPRLLGRPVVMYDGTGWDNAVAIAANEEVGAFGDFSQYYFINRVGMTVSRDDSRYFETDQVAFKARIRYDSLFAENDAFRIVKGDTS